MKKTLFATGVISGVALVALSTAPAHAADMMELAKQKQCLSCHSVDKDMIGPSFQNIAKRFDGLKNAQIMLEDVVIKGSDAATGHWGTDRKMPPSSARAPVSKAEAKQLVEWILSQK